MKILEVKDLRKIYGKGETLVKALDGVSFSVEKGKENFWQWWEPAAAESPPFSI